MDYPAYPPRYCEREQILNRRSVYGWVPPPPPRVSSSLKGPGKWYVITLENLETSDFNPVKNKATYLWINGDSYSTGLVRVSDNLKTGRTQLRDVSLRLSDGRSLRLHGSLMMKKTDRSPDPTFYLSGSVKVYSTFEILKIEMRVKSGEIFKQLYPNTSCGRKRKRDTGGASSSNQHTFGYKIASDRKDIRFYELLGRYQSTPEEVSLLSQYLPRRALEITLAYIAPRRRHATKIRLNLEPKEFHRVANMKTYLWINGGQCRSHEIIRVSDNCKPGRRRFSQLVLNLSNGCLVRLQGSLMRSESRHGVTCYLGRGSISLAGEEGGGMEYVDEKGGEESTRSFPIFDVALGLANGQILKRLHPSPNGSSHIEETTDHPRSDTIPVERAKASGTTTTTTTTTTAAAAATTTTTQKAAKESKKSNPSPIPKKEALPLLRSNVDQYKAGGGEDVRGKERVNNARIRSQIAATSTLDESQRKTGIVLKFTLELLSQDFVVLREAVHFAEDVLRATRKRAEVEEEEAPYTKLRGEGSSRILEVSQMLLKAEYYSRAHEVLQSALAVWSQQKLPEKVRKLKFPTVLPAIGGVNNNNATTSTYPIPQGGGGGGREGGDGGRRGGGREGAGLLAGMKRMPPQITASSPSSSLSSMLQDIGWEKSMLRMVQEENRRNRRLMEENRALQERITKMQQEQHLLRKEAMENSSASNLESMPMVAEMANSSSGQRVKDELKLLLRVPEDTGESSSGDDGYCCRFRMTLKESTRDYTPELFYVFPCRDNPNSQSSASSSSSSSTSSSHQQSCSEYKLKMQVVRRIRGGSGEPIESRLLRFEHEDGFKLQLRFLGDRNPFYEDRKEGGGGGGGGGDSSNISGGASSSNSSSKLSFLLKSDKSRTKSIPEVVEVMTNKPVDLPHVRYGSLESLSWVVETKLLCNDVVAELLVRAPWKMQGFGAVQQALARIEARLWEEEAIATEVGNLSFENGSPPVFLLRFRSYSRSRASSGGLSGGKNAQLLLAQTAGRVLARLGYEVLQHKSGVATIAAAAAAAVGKQ